jgi:preprotein translocase subunit YajC
MAGLLFPLLLLVVMYVFLILPQRRKQKAAGDLLGSLAPGDEVMTTGGIYGGVTEIDGDDLYLEIAPDIEIKVSKRAIASRVYAAGDPKPGASPAAGSPKPVASEPEPEPEPEPDLGDVGKDEKNKK